MVIGFKIFVIQSYECLLACQDGKVSCYLFEMSLWLFYNNIQFNVINM